jgi:hypothetical protein
VRNNARALQQVVDKAHAIPILAKLLLEVDDRDALCAVCALLAVLCSNNEELKEAAVKAGVVPMLLRLAQDSSDESLVQAASAALMHVVLVRSGKYALYECEGLPIIHALLRSGSEHIQAHALESVTSLAEAPECKAKMAELGVVASIQELAASTALPHIARCAAQAIRQLHFSTRPFAALHECN